jgi:hypothetical protein
MPRTASGAASHLPPSFEAARPEHHFAQKQEGEAQERAVQEEQLSIYIDMLAALNKFWMRGHRSTSSWM